jgi:hypothetical protein
LGEDEAARRGVAMRMSGRSGGLIVNWIVSNSGSER